MIILITGASHTGKTLLAQRMLEEYKYPYLSIDHLKMGLIRSGQTTNEREQCDACINIAERGGVRRSQTALTPEDDDALTDYLWPIVREIVKTAIENQQNLIVEGCYIPSNWRQDFREEYLQSIGFICLAMTDEYIDTHFDEIRKHASVIETRLHDTDFTLDSLKTDNHCYIDSFTQDGEQITLIETAFEESIKKLVKRQSPI
jgi:gluconate kinase